MWRGVGAVLVALSVVGAGCGRFKKTMPPAPDASFDNTSHVALSADSIRSDAAIDLTGPAFARVNAQMDELEIMIADPKNNPPPSCEYFAALGDGSPIKSGTVVTLTIMGAAAPKPGDFTITMAAYFKQQPTAADPVGLSMGGGPLDSRTLKISQADATSLVGVAAGDDGGPPFASIHATMCKPAPPMAQSTAAGGSMGQGTAMDSQGLADMPRPNLIDMQLPDGKKQTTGGDTALVKLDPKAKLLAIYVWEFGLTPMPTCETFATAPRDAIVGQFAMVTVPNFPKRKTGKFKVGGGEFFDLEIAPPSLTSDRGTFDATTIEITDFNDGIFNATISSAEKAKAKVSGKLNSAVCPDGPIHFPARKKSGKNR